jgi:taurine dioxygenase
MDIQVNKNGWSIDISGADVRALSDDQIKQIAPLITGNITVVLKDQPSLTPDEYRSFAHKLGKVQNDHTSQDIGEMYSLPDSGKEIIRVTGAKDNDGQVIGIFGQKEELIWHANECGRQDRPDVLCLYSIQGSEGSITSYTNTQIAYQDLLKCDYAPDGLLEDLPYLVAHYDYGVNIDDVKNTLAGPNYKARPGSYPVLLKNKSGKSGIYISPKQRPLLFKNGVELDRKTKYNYVTFLYDFLTQEKYVYNHHWKDGEIVLNCQWHSLHKRNQFEAVEKRMLWRIMINV